MATSVEVRTVRVSVEVYGRVSLPTQDGVASAGRFPSRVVGARGLRVEASEVVADVLVAASAS